MRMIAVRLTLALPLAAQQQTPPGLEARMDTVFRRK